ncbi:MAG TPA: hypothetical protein VGG41_18900 [Solirubrobacteraceae bacterium]|jgi:hypothetical protein
MRRLRLPMWLLATVALCACAQGIALGRSAEPARWPFAELQIGLADQPGGAAALAAVAPMRLRYQYLSGGVNTGSGWETWNQNGSFVSRYVAESRAHDLVSVFSYYQIRQSLPGARNSDESAADLGNLANVATMRAYLLDLETFFKRASAAGGTVVLHLEPDLFGYIELAAHGDAARVPAAVASTRLAPLRGFANNASGFAQAVLALRDRFARNVLVGYPISVWGTSVDIHLNHPSPAHVDAMAAQSVAFYRSLHAHFDVSFSEVTDRDAGYAQTVDHQSGAWWHAVDFGRDLRFLADYHRAVALPIVIWQIPLGNTVSPLVNNTPFHYRDNKVQWFLGAGVRSHLLAFAHAGVVALLFGGGQAQDTDAGEDSGDGRPDDGGYFDARARAYYRAGAIALPSG